LAEPQSTVGHRVNPLPATKRGSLDGAAARPTKARSRRATGRGRTRSVPGANEPIILKALEGESEPLDIKTVAKKAGLSVQAASHTLRKLAGSGLLVQSSRAGGRGMPKLLFRLASTEKPRARQDGREAEIAASQPARRPKRKAQKRARPVKAAARRAGPAAGRA
jgi:predicted transcriptional regulator